MAPITWKNVNAPSFTGASDILEQSARRFDKAFGVGNDIIAGGQKRHQEGIDLTSQAFLDQMRSQFATPEALRAAQGSGALDQLRGEYGQLNADMTGRNAVDSLIKQGVTDQRAETTYQRGEDAYAFKIGQQNRDLRIQRENDADTRLQKAAEPAQQELGRQISQAQTLDDYDAIVSGIDNPDMPYYDRNARRGEAVSAQMGFVKSEYQKLIQNEDPIGAKALLDRYNIPNEAELNGSLVGLNERLSSEAKVNRAEDVKQVSVNDQLADEAQAVENQKTLDAFLREGGIDPATLGTVDYTEEQLGVLKAAQEIEAGLPKVKSVTERQREIRRALSEDKSGYTLREQNAVASDFGIQVGSRQVLSPEDQFAFDAEISAIDNHPDFARSSTVQAYKNPISGPALEAKLRADYGADFFDDFDGLFQGKATQRFFNEATRNGISWEKADGTKVQIPLTEPMVRNILDRAKDGYFNDYTFMEAAEDYVKDTVAYEDVLLAEQYLVMKNGATAKYEALKDPTRLGSSAILRSYDTDSALAALRRNASPEQPNERQGESSVTRDPLGQAANRSNPRARIAESSDTGNGSRGISGRSPAAQRASSENASGPSLPLGQQSVTAETRFSRILEEAGDKSATEIRSDISEQRALLEEVRNGSRGRGTSARIQSIEQRIRDLQLLLP